MAKIKAVFRTYNLENLAIFISPVFRHVLQQVSDITLSENI